MEIIIWFLLGLFVGYVSIFVAVLYLGNREITKRQKRSADWQKKKRDIDKDIMDEYGI